MLLLDKHHAPAKGSNSGGKPSKFASRWKLIISSYNQVRMRVLNSEELLDHTGLHLFAINEFTLVSVVFCPLATTNYSNINAVTMVQKHHQEG